MADTYLSLPYIYPHVFGDRLSISEFIDVYSRTINQPKPSVDPAPDSDSSSSSSPPPPPPPGRSTHAKASVDNYNQHIIPYLKRVFVNTPYLVDGSRRLLWSNWIKSEASARKWVTFGSKPTEFGSHIPRVNVGDSITFDDVRDWVCFMACVASVRPSLLSASIDYIETLKPNANGDAMAHVLKACAGIVKHIEMLSQKVPKPTVRVYAVPDQVAPIVFDREPTEAVLKLEHSTVEDFCGYYPRTDYYVRDVWKHGIASWLAPINIIGLPKRPPRASKEQQLQLQNPTPEDGCIDVWVGPKATTPHAEVRWIHERLKFPEYQQVCGTIVADVLSVGSKNKLVRIFYAPEWAALASSVLTCLLVIGSQFKKRAPPALAFVSGGGEDDDGPESDDESDDNDVWHLLVYREVRRLMWLSMVLLERRTPSPHSETKPRHLHHCCGCPASEVVKPKTSYIPLIPDIGARLAAVARQERMRLEEDDTCVVCCWCDYSLNADSLRGFATPSGSLPFSNPVFLFDRTTKGWWSTHGHPLIQRSDSGQGKQLHLKVPRPRPSKRNRAGQPPSPSPPPPSTDVDIMGGGGGGGGGRSAAVGPTTNGIHFVPYESHRKRKPVDPDSDEDASSPKGVSFLKRSKHGRPPPQHLIEQLEMMAGWGGLGVLMLIHDLVHDSSVAHCDWSSVAVSLPRVVGPPPRVSCFCPLLRAGRSTPSAVERLFSGPSLFKVLYLSHHRHHILDHILDRL